VVGVNDIKDFLEKYRYLYAEYILLIGTKSLKNSVIFIFILMFFVMGVVCPRFGSSMRISTVMSDTIFLH